MEKLFSGFDLMFMVRLSIFFSIMFFVEIVIGWFSLNFSFRLSLVIGDWFLLLIGLLKLEYSESWLFTLSLIFLVFICVVIWWGGLCCWGRCCWGGCWLLLGLRWCFRKLIWVVWRKVCISFVLNVSFCCNIFCRFVMCIFCNFCGEVG